MKKVMHNNIKIRKPDIPVKKSVTFFLWDAK